MTGAGSGIGAATAALLTATGLRVLHLDRAFADDKPETSGRTEVAADVTDRGAVHEGLARALGDDTLTYVVNCAGVLPANGFADVPDSAWRHALDVNLIGAYHVMDAAAAHLAAAPGAAVVNVTSLEADRVVALSNPDPNPQYAASKAALRMLTKSAVEPWPRVGPASTRSRPASCARRWPHSTGEGRRCHRRWRAGCSWAVSPRLERSRTRSRSCSVTRRATSRGVTSGSTEGRAHMNSGDPTPDVVGFDASLGRNARLGTWEALTRHVPSRDRRPRGAEVRRRRGPARGLGPGGRRVSTSTSGGPGTPLSGSWAKASPRIASPRSRPTGDCHRSAGDGGDRGRVERLHRLRSVRRRAVPLGEP